MSPKFLIDNCLSHELADMAIDRGYVESRHLKWRGKKYSGQQNWGDHNVRKLAVEGGYTLVTKNSVDFRGPPDAPGSKGEYTKADIHDGLVCLNAEGMDLDLQMDMFAYALEQVQSLSDDMINRVLDISYDPETDIIRHDLYELPARP